MAKNPIRRSQLIAPFGVGAMVVVQGGIGLLTAGLDHWFEREDGGADADEDEYIVEEWRLQKLLGVEHFRLPPDYREPWRFDGSVPNVGLTVPFHRFPRWHFCPRCGRLYERPLSERGRSKCQDPNCSGYLFQVPFVSMCEAGHLQDFPWREWVHGQRVPNCDGTLRLRSTGSASLSGQKVTCDKCGKERTLSRITEASPDGSTFLSRNLISGSDEYYCPGHLTWLGEGQREECNAHVRGTLRSASNVYFAKVYGSLYLPRGNQSVPEPLIELLSTPPISTMLSVTLGALEGIGIPDKVEAAVGSITNRYSQKFVEYSQDQILQATRIALKDSAIGGSDEETLFDELEFRREEYRVLRESASEELLSIKPANLSNYASEVSSYFSRIMLVDRLRETRVLTGFSRVYAENEQSLLQRKTMLRRNNSGNEWLPAYVVYGEGIFFEFDERQIATWERTPAIIERIQKLEERYLAVQQRRKLRDQEISPRFVLLHTFAHIVMNRLTFECGYSSAALKERLYISSDSDAPMGAVLIYTADGDAEGTMGGLVRMGKPGYLEPVIQRALLDATWCSVDPVCTEIGGSGGQGPDSCNLAACHNCALVPETACEHFNRFLDRVTVVGDISKPDMGYFSVR
jgi:hypothetical protein